MSKTVTLRLDEEVYFRFKQLAEADNRPLSNYIETAAMRYAEENAFIDAFEMAEVNANTDLKRSLDQARKDVVAGKGRFVCVPVLQDGGAHPTAHKA